MKEDYNLGLQKAMDECKELYSECVKYMDDCTKCPYSDKNCKSGCRVFDELLGRLEKSKKK